MFCNGTSEIASTNSSRSNSPEKCEASPGASRDRSQSTDRQQESGGGTIKSPRSVPGGRTRGGRQRFSRTRSRSNRSESETEVSALHAGNLFKLQLNS